MAECIDDAVLKKNLIENFINWQSLISSILYQNIFLFLSLVILDLGIVGFFLLFYRTGII